MRSSSDGGSWLKLLAVLIDLVEIVTALVLLIDAVVELLKYFLNRSRVELLKEIKGLELQFRELKDLLQGPARPRVTGD